MTEYWAANDPDGAAPWLALLSESNSQTSAYRSYINVLARSYPETAPKWIENVPENLVGEIVAEYADVTISHNPQLALAELLKYTPNNHKLISQAMEQYHRLQPDAARKRLDDFASDLGKSIEERVDMNDQWRALTNPR